MSNCWRWPIFFTLCKRSSRVQLHQGSANIQAVWRPRRSSAKSCPCTVHLRPLAGVCARERERGVWGLNSNKSDGAERPCPSQLLLAGDRDQALCKPCSMFTLDRGSPCFTHNVWPNIMERQPRGEGVRARARSGYSLPTSMGKGSRRFHTFGKFCS
jgi:hypothetical protein